MNIINSMILTSNSYYQKIFKNPYFPIFLAGFLMLIHFLAGYPGGMTGDSLDQFNQSISFNFNPHHPPLTTFIWSILHKIYVGPQTMLFLHLSLLWTGVVVMFYSDPTNKFRKLYFITPFLPNILVNSEMIWKDVDFSFSTFLATAICIYYVYNKQRSPLFIFITLLILCFYAVGAKFQAQFLIPVVVFFALKVCFSLNWLLRVIACVALSLALVQGNDFLIQRLSPGSLASADLRTGSDLVGISIDINDDSILPEYMKKGKLYSFEKVKEVYTPITMDPLYWYKDSPIPRATNVKEMNDVYEAWSKAVFSYPLSYLKHRGKLFYHMLTRNDFIFGNCEDDVCKTQASKAINNTLKNWTQGYIKLFSRLTTNLISLILLIVYLITCIKNFRNNAPESIVLRYITALGIVFSLTVFITVMCSDYRYYYVVRVLTFMSIPIYLKILIQKRTV